MILINKNSSNEVVLTLSEKTSITSPTYLFEFTNDSTKQTKVFISADYSNNKERFNVFNIIETSTEVPLTGRVSLTIGDWKYKGNSTTRETDENQNLLKESLVDVDGGRVGDAAQTTWGLGADYFLSKNVSFDLDWRTYDKLYANSGAIKENLMLPTYDLVDAGATYKMFVGKNKQNTMI